jgi:hypothetical protein
METITPTKSVARYMELEELHNETIQQLNTSFGGATATIFSYDPTEKTGEKLNKNADFMLKRLEQISTLNKCIKELNELIQQGVVEQVHAYYAELREAYRGE